MRRKGSGIWVAVRQAHGDGREVWVVGDPQQDDATNVPAEAADMTYGDVVDNGAVLAYAMVPGGGERYLCL